MTSGPWLWSEVRAWWTIAWEWAKKVFSFSILTEELTNGLTLGDAVGDASEKKRRLTWELARDRWTRNPICFLRWIGVVLFLGRRTSGWPRAVAPTSRWGGPYTQCPLPLGTMRCGRACPNQQYWARRHLEMLRLQHCSWYLWTPSLGAHLRCSGRGMKGLGAVRLPLLESETCWRSQRHCKTWLVATSKGHCVYLYRYISDPPGLVMLVFWLLHILSCWHLLLMVMYQSEASHWDVYLCSRLFLQPIQNTTLRESCWGLCRFSLYGQGGLTWSLNGKILATRWFLHVVLREKWPQYAKIDIFESISPPG